MKPITDTLHDLADVTERQEALDKERSELFATLEAALPRPCPPQFVLVHHYRRGDRLVSVGRSGADHRGDVVCETVPMVSDYAFAAAAAPAADPDATEDDQRGDCLDVAAAACRA